MIAKASIVPKQMNFLQQAKSPVVALYGGARSGKTVSICQELVRRLYAEPPGYVVLIIRKTGPSLMRTAYIEIKKVLESYGMKEGVDYRENRMPSERSITVGKNTMWFFSFGSDVDAQRGVEKLKSLSATDAYVNEATEISKAEYDQIKLRLSNKTHGRPNQLFLDFNPTDPYHFTKLEILDHVDGKEISALHSTYLDNPYLPEAYHKTLKGFEDRGELETYKIYALGEYAMAGSQIYNNFVVDQWAWTESPLAIGLDFGFNNPSALAAVWYRDGELYLQQLIYESHLTNQDLIEKMKSVIPSGWRGVTIYADAAEPARIEEISRAGFQCRPADKDVHKGIDRIKSYRLHVLQGSDDLVRELRGYKWREDRNGRVLDEPVKLNDHLLDAVRYAVASSQLADVAAINSPLSWKADKPQSNITFMKQSQPMFSSSKRIPGMY